VLQDNLADLPVLLDQEKSLQLKVFLQLFRLPKRGLPESAATAVQNLMKDRCYYCIYREIILNYMGEVALKPAGMSCTA
jgi:hypothetical protein